MICAVCGLPIDEEVEDDHYEVCADRETAWHADCCPVCKPAEMRSGEELGNRPPGPGSSPEPTQEPRQ